MAGSCPALLLAMLFSCALALALHRVSSDASPPPLALGAPLALAGFVIAATWIDTIANELVAALQFFGTLMRVPQPVLGLTVLAWGNSIGDYSTNMAMARKGLANMAMTACFAGPVFNMLVGLGLGFSLLLHGDNADAHPQPVHLSNALAVGLVFLAVNSVAIGAFGVLNYAGG